MTLKPPITTPSSRDPQQPLWLALVFAMTSKFLLQPRRSPTHGYGLYTQQALPAQSEVITFVRGKVASARADIPWRIPEDAVIEQALAPSGSRFHYDDALRFLDPQTAAPCRSIPRWWWLNHSFRPNLKLQLSPSTRTVRWVALRDIAAGEELTFRYGRFDTKWLLLWLQSISTDSLASDERKFIHAWLGRGPEPHLLNDQEEADRREAARSLMPATRSRKRRLPS